jgi:hypothetical protein
MGFFVVLRWIAMANRCLSVGKESRSQQLAWSPQPFDVEQLLATVERAPPGSERLRVRVAGARFHVVVALLGPSPSR